MSINDLKFHHPFTCIVAGMTSSGKTVFVRRLISNWDKVIKNLNIEKLNCLWCFSETKSVLRNVLLKRFIDGEYNFVSTEEALISINELEEQENKDSYIPENYKCKVCTEKLIGVAFHPCGHVLCCSFCGPCFSNCIECREDIRAYTKIYLP